LTLRDLRKPKLRRRIDSGQWITDPEYLMSVRSESRQEEHVEEEIRPQPLDQSVKDQQWLDPVELQGG
jgi:hypothetical protein